MRKLSLNLCIALITLTVPTWALAQNDENEAAFRKWAPTPPMGWNSWDCYGPSVVESEVMNNARYMSSRLKEQGWEYVVVDIRWYVDNQTTGSYLQDGTQQYSYDEYGRYLPGPTRFPSSAGGKGFKPMADSIHALGLKFGIHIMRGVPRIAVTKRSPILGCSYTCNQIYKTDSLCGWLTDNYSIDCTKPGAQEYYNSIIDLYASWGVDFIKVDDLSRPYHDGEIALLRNAIDRCGRPIVLSMSPGATPLEKAASCRAHANMWRMMDDYWDLWSDLENEFTLCAKWAPYYRPGNYPDCDMLPLGYFVRGERATNRTTRFTADEQRTMMTLFGIFHSPLFFGGDLPRNDEATHALLANREMLAMHHYGVNAREVSNRDGRVVWSSENPADGSRYVALFNTAGADNWIAADRALYRTETISKLTSGYGQEVAVDIPAGSTLLALATDDSGDNYSYDHGDWARPTLVFEDGTEDPLNIADTVRTQTRGAFYKYIGVNRNILSSGSLVIGDSTFEKGFSTHANTLILFSLPTTKRTVKFKAYVGIDRTSTSQSGATPTLKFMVFNCDPTPRTVCDPFRAKASSGYVSRTRHSSGVQMTADITGATKLYLVVSNGDDNFNYDHADWVNPTLIDAEGNTTPLTRYNYTSAVTDWQNLAVKNRNVDGGTLNINGTAYTQGIGTNSNAVITYDLPADKQFVTFTSLVGYDYAMRNAPNGVTMEFYVFTEDPAPVYHRAVEIDLAAVGIEAGRSCSIYNIWEGREAGSYKDSEFADTLRQHASSLYRVTPLGRRDVNHLTLTRDLLGGDSLLLTATLNGEVDASSYVQFLCNGVPLQSVPVTESRSVACWVCGYPAGEYTFTALYSGTASTAQTASEPLTVRIDGTAVTTATLPAERLITVSDSVVHLSPRVAKVMWYTPNGECHCRWQRGLNLARMVLHDGTVKVEKVIL